MPVVDGVEAGIPGNWVVDCDAAGAMPFCMDGEVTWLPLGVSAELAAPAVMPGSVIRADCAAGSDALGESGVPVAVRAWLPQADVGLTLGPAGRAADVVKPLWLIGLRLAVSDSQPDNVTPVNTKPIKAILGFEPIGFSFLLD
jgi:hypothetical protein